MIVTAPTETESSNIPATNRTMLHPHLSPSNLSGSLYYHDLLAKERKPPLGCLEHTCRDAANSWPPHRHWMDHQQKLHFCLQKTYFPLSSDPTQSRAVGISLVNVTSVRWRAGGQTGRPIPRGLGPQVANNASSPWWAGLNTSYPQDNASPHRLPREPHFASPHQSTWAQTMEYGAYLLVRCNPSEPSHGPLIRDCLPTR